MPNIESLNICDNRLTDESLGPILSAAAHIPTLTKLDVGSNKMDEEASEALANLLRTEDCPMRRENGMRKGLTVVVPFGIPLEALWKPFKRINRGQ